MTQPGLNSSNAAKFINIIAHFYSVQSIILKGNIVGLSKGICNYPAVKKNHYKPLKIKQIEKKIIVCSTETA